MQAMPMMFFDGFSVVAVVVIDWQECCVERMRQDGRIEEFAFVFPLMFKIGSHRHWNRILISIEKKRLTSSPPGYYLVTVGIGTFSLLSSRHPHASSYYHILLGAL